MVRCRQRIQTGVPFMINKVLAQSNSVLWLITDGGLFSFNKNTKSFSGIHSENRGDEWKAFDDCTDALFISDTANNDCVTVQRPYTIQSAEEQFQNIIQPMMVFQAIILRGLYADKYDGLWITTTNGLSRLNLKTQTFSRYDYSNGLKDLTFPSM